MLCEVIKVEGNRYLLPGYQILRATLWHIIGNLPGNFPARDLIRNQLFARNLRVNMSSG